MKDESLNDPDQVEPRMAMDPEPMHHSTVLLGREVLVTHPSFTPRV